MAARADQRLCQHCHPGHHQPDQQRRGEYLPPVHPIRRGYPGQRHRWQQRLDQYLGLAYHLDPLRLHLLLPDGRGGLGRNGQRQRWGSEPDRLHLCQPHGHHGQRQRHRRECCRHSGLLSGGRSSQRQRWGLEPPGYWRKRGCHLHLGHVRVLGRGGAPAAHPVLRSIPGAGAGVGQRRDRCSEPRRGGRLVHVRDERCRLRHRAELLQRDRPDPHQPGPDHPATGAATDGGASPFPLGGATVVQLEGGDEWTVALDTTGLLWAFGQNDAGQLGNGTSTNNPVPTPVTVSGGASNFIGLAQYGSVSGGSNHCIALDSTGAVWGWGGNSNGQLGLGAAGGQRVHPNAVLPVGGGAGQLGVSPSPPVSFVSVGDHTSFCLMDGGMQVAAFGQNENGQCGTGSTPPNNITTPTLMSLTGLALPILAVSGGGGAGVNDGHTLVVDNNNMLWACGDNTYGQLGQGTTDTNPAHPQLIPVLTSSGGVITGTQFQVLDPLAGLGRRPALHGRRPERDPSGPGATTSTPAPPRTRSPGLSGLAPRSSTPASPSR